MQGVCKRPRRRMRQYAAQGSAAQSAADEPFSAELDEDSLADSKQTDSHEQ